MAEFPDVKPFPEATLDRHHNQPPLEDQVGMEFDEAVRAEGLDQRVAEIAASAERAPDPITPDNAGAVGDLVKMAGDAEKAIEAEREKLNRPLLTAQRSLKAKADNLVAPMHAAITVVRARLDEFAAAEGVLVRGDLGARVAAQTEWKFEVTDFAKLPIAIRKHPTVLEAINKVIARQIKAGERKIAGVKIWPATKASVR